MTGSIQENSVLKELVRRIVESVSPSRVILFGSRARGTGHIDSDYDLLVVMPLKGSRREAKRAIYHSLYGLGVAKDVIVATPDEVRYLGGLVGSILKPALAEGVTLYERAA